MSGNLFNDPRIYIYIYIYILFFVAKDNFANFLTFINFADKLNFFIPSNMQIIDKVIFILVLRTKEMSSVSNEKRLIEILFSIRLSRR